MPILSVRGFSHWDKPNQAATLHALMQLERRLRRAVAELEILGLTTENVTVDFTTSLLPLDCVICDVTGLLLAPEGKEKRTPEVCAQLGVRIRNTLRDFVDEQKIKSIHHIEVFIHPFDATVCEAACSTRKPID